MLGLVAVTCVSLRLSPEYLSLPYVWILSVLGIWMACIAWRSRTRVAKIAAANVALLCVGILVFEVHSFRVEESSRRYYPRWIYTCSNTNVPGFVGTDPVVGLRPWPNNRVHAEISMGGRKVEAVY
jgi:hypothetical protein